MRTISKLRIGLVGVFLLCASAGVHGAILFSDDFNDGNANGWSVMKDGSGTPAWQVTNGSYRQSNRLRNFTQSFHTGTYAYYKNGLNFTDYVLSVKIIPDAIESVGVMFRYQNNSNYYRFSINRSQGFSRLEKRVNGSFQTLAFDGRGPDFSKPHTVTIDLKGSNILVYLDGEPLFGAVDSSLRKGSVGLFSQHRAAFDDVVIESSSTAAKVVISKPVSYSVEPTGTLAVAAVALGVPSGGGVRFTLDNRRSFTDQTAPYSGSFTNVSLGDHVITAAIVDGAGMAMPGSAAQDTNRIVGTNARYFVAMGDSITSGSNDDIAGDDASADQRNVSRGFTPILNDWLSLHVAVPITVMNEGLGGTTAGKGGSSGASRVGSTLSRHAESQYWLIMFGTNDASRGVPSGKGLLPGDSGYSGSFKDSMQKIISSLKVANKTPILAKVPFRAGVSASTDQRIRDYNVVIDELLEANGLLVTPPDFYTHFKKNPDQLADKVHPDGHGYKAMADLWFDALASSGILGP